MKLKIPAGAYQAFPFDCDGTITDSMPLYYVARNRALAEWNCDFPEDLFYAGGGFPVAEIISRLNLRCWSISMRSMAGFLLRCFASHASVAGKVRDLSLCRRFRKRETGPRAFSDRCRTAGGENRSVAEHAKICDCSLCFKRGSVLQWLGQRPTPAAAPALSLDPPTHPRRISIANVPPTGRTLRTNQALVRGRPHSLRRYHCTPG
jgi:hypothetical protein